MGKKKKQSYKDYLEEAYEKGQIDKETRDQFKNNTSTYGYTNKNNG